MDALIYVSSARALPSRSMVDGILAAAYRNNPKSQLTGMLLWREMSFAQLLEGPTDALDEMYGRLLADPRHEDVRLLSRWPIEERLFAEWSMASRRLDRRQHWELLERNEGETDEDYAGWILHLMNEAHHAGRRRPARGEDIE
jgi:hypothetical protein